MTEKKLQSPAADDNSNPSATAEPSAVVSGSASAASGKLDKKSDKKPDQKPDQKPANQSATKPGFKSESKPTIKPEAKKGAGLWKTIFVLLLLAALAGSSWLAWMQWQQRSALTESFDSSLADIEAKLAQQQQLARRTAEQQLKLISDLQDQLYAQRLMANRQAEQIQTLGSATQGDWLLAEAAYLVRLADQRLQVERSAEIPLAILENVDAIFVQINDPDLAAVRNALAVDIAALRMTEKVDREGIYLELQAVSAALESLAPLTAPDQLTANSEAVGEDGAEQKSFSVTETLAHFGEKLGNLIVVQKRQQPVEPLLSGAELTTVRQNIYLLLQQAQSALMREQQSIYSSSLRQAETLLQRYFQLNSQSAALLSRLQALEALPINQQLPDISGSRGAIQTALNLRHNSAADREQAK